jgi:hypothetical protein
MKLPNWTQRFFRPAIHALPDDQLARCFAAAPTHPIWTGIQQVLAEHKQECLSLAMQPDLPADQVKNHVQAAARVGMIESHLDDLQARAQALLDKDAKGKNPES